MDTRVVENMFIFQNNDGELLLKVQYKEQRHSFQRPKSDQSSVKTC